jgi:hypothetical protein
MPLTHSLKIQYVHASNCTGLVANGIRLTKRCNALSSRSDVTRGLPDLGKSFTLLVCVCFLITQNSVCSRFEYEYLSPVFYKMYSFSVSMLRRWISEPQRWQIISMHTTGMSVSNCSCWQTSIEQPVLFEYGTGCAWHPSNQTLQCPVVTIRCYPWSAGSWQVFHIVGIQQGCPSKLLDVWWATTIL